MSRGFSQEEVYRMTIRQVMFLSEVNVRLMELEKLEQIYTLIAATNRGIDDMSFNSMINQLKYGRS